MKGEYGGQKFRMTKEDIEAVAEARKRLKEAINAKLDLILGTEEIGYGLIPMAKQVAAVATDPDRQRQIVKQDYRGAVKLLLDQRFGNTQQIEHSGSIQHGVSADELAQLKAEVEGE